MRFIIGVFVLLDLRAAAQQPISRVAFSEYRQAVRAFSSAGEVTLPALRVQLKIGKESGKEQRGDLTIIYDPQYGHYLWRLMPSNGPSDTTNFVTVLDSGKVAIYTGAGEIVDFGASNAIYAQAHRDRADSLDDAANSAITEIQGNFSWLSKNGFDTGFTQVPIFRAVGMDFACAPYPQSDENCTFGIKNFVSISREEGNWRLVVRNRWDQEIILDRQFKLIRTQRLQR